MTDHSYQFGGAAASAQRLGRNTMLARGLSALSAIKAANNKRKRESADLDSASTRPAPVPEYARASTNDGTADLGDFPHLTTHTTGEHDDDMDTFESLLRQHAGGQNESSNSNGTVQSASDTASAALAQHYSMTVPQPTEASFMTTTTTSADGDGGRPSSASFNLGEQNSMQQGTTAYPDIDVNATNSDKVTGDQRSPSEGAAGNAVSGSNSSKPAVGSDEWHKVRRDNHKEVERRRRETINEGINELAKIVPGCEKNKGSILQRAVQFITQLKENESQNIEKWTLEKLLTEQAIAELSASCDKLKKEATRAWAECEKWKTKAEELGASDAVEKEEGGDAIE
ncbi:basic helix-loop-helix protein [Elasticomyces elasticus]|nr:basic helix-loop-helix protein [Elasticomyces elasticus]